MGRVVSSTSVDREELDEDVEVVLRALERRRGMEWKCISRLV
jgi:hypothetical protein